MNLYHRLTSIRAVLDRQLGSRGEFAHALEYRVRRGRIAIAQEEIQRSRIDLGPVRHRCTNRAHLRAEIQTILIDSVVEQLDSEWIAGENQPPLSRIPDGQAEHAIEAIEHLIAPLLVSVDDDLGVRLRAENVAVAFQFTPEFKEVVDFAIENHPNGFFLIRHGLMTARKIDDREPAKAESERSGDVVPLVIRTSMDDASWSSPRCPGAEQAPGSEVILSANAAHRRSLACSLRLERLNGIAAILSFGFLRFCDSKKQRLRNICD